MKDIRCAVRSSCGSSIELTFHVKLCRKFKQPQRPIFYFLVLSCPASETQVSKSVRRGRVSKSVRTQIKCVPCPVKIVEAHGKKKCSYQVGCAHNRQTLTYVTTTLTNTTVRSKQTRLKKACRNEKANTKRQRCQTNTLQVWWLSSAMRFSSSSLDRLRCVSTFLNLSFFL